MIVGGSCPRNFVLGEKTIRVLLLRIFDEKEAMAGVSFVFSKPGPSHHKSEIVKLLWDRFCHYVMVVSVTKVVKGVFCSSSSCRSISGAALVA